MRVEQFFAFCFLIISCNVEGVKKNENTKITENTNFKHDTLTAKDLDSTFLLEEEDKNFASEKINYDTAFNFTSNKIISTTKTKSGIAIEILARNNDKKIKKSDVVSLVYQGKLKTGKVIESSKAFNKPLPFYVGLGMTFEAFDEVLAMSNLGDKIRFTIPASAAYGKKGHGELIPPNNDLIYEMHIVGTTKPLTTSDGIKMYKIIDKPLARQVEYSDKLKIGYMGWTENGKLFDASVFHGKDAEVDLALNTAIKGWKFSLILMHEGEKAMVCIPSALGYGSKGVPEMVPPNSNLIYVLEVKQAN